MDVAGSGSGSGRRGLEALFTPRSVAVLGASRREAAIGHQVFKNLLDAGFRGPVYPINPGAEAIRSVRAYPDLASVGAPVDLAVICLPAPQVLAAVDDCARAGVRGLVLLSAGFGEVGGEGAALQAKLKAKLDASGMRAVGPNCLGLVHTDPAVRLNATFAPQYPPEGRVAFASQSGALGVAILDQARDLGIGISTFVSVGNRVDLPLHELLEHWESDPRTGVVLLYLESFGDPERFREAARRVARTTPIVAVKSGRSHTGQAAVSSHTGALAGGDRAADALFGQAGVIRVDTVEQLFDTAMLLANQPLPPGRRLGILTNAGGPGIMATDAAEAAGLAVPTTSAALQARLRSFLPAAAAVKNPVDMIASAGPAEFDAALAAMLASGEFDSLLVLFVPPVAAETEAVADRIVAHASGGSTPVVTCFLGTHGVPAALRTLGGADVPSYRYPEAAVRSLARAAAYREWRERPAEAPPPPPPVDRARADAALAEVDDDGWLLPDAAAALLKAHGIPHVESRFARGGSEAAAAAESLGYPVAMKLVAEGITHKTDVGGVRLGLTSATQVRLAAEGMAAALEAAGYRDAWRGVQLQPMVPDGVEIALGATRDPASGPLVMIGTGGVNLELLGDVSFLLPPLDAGDVRRAIRGLKGWPLLDGYRGRPPADVPALEASVHRVGRILAAHPEVQELDVNPLMVLPAGRGAVAVDVRVRVGAR